MELRELALSSYYNSLLELHKELQKYGIGSVYVPNTVRKKAELLGKKLFMLIGRFGSGKTSVLVALRLEYGKPHNAFLGDVQDLLNSRRLYEYRGLFLDELERLRDLTKEEEDISKVFRIVRHFFEKFMPVVLASKTRGEIEEELMYGSGAVIRSDMIEYVDLMSPSVRMEINEFLLERNVKILEIDHARNFDRLKELVLKERDRLSEITPRAFNYATLGSDSKPELGSSVIARELENRVRRFYGVSRGFSKKHYAYAEGALLLVEFSPYESGATHGPDVVLRATIKSGSEIIDEKLIGIEVKTLERGSRIPKKQLEEFLKDYDALLYLVFTSKPTFFESYPRVFFMNIPRLLAYLSNEYFTDFFNAVISENDPLDDIAEHLASTTKVNRVKQEGVSEAVKALIEIMRDKINQVANRDKNYAYKYLTDVLKELKKRGLKIDEKDLMRFVEEANEYLMERNLRVKLKLTKNTLRVHRLRAQRGFSISPVGSFHEALQSVSHLRTHEGREA